MNIGWIIIIGLVCFIAGLIIGSDKGSEKSWHESNYEDWLNCETCLGETLHDVHDESNERDTRGHKTCKVCNTKTPL